MLMDKNIKVSVIMTVYNAEKYIKAAVDSITSQSFKNFELIIVNDGSTDRSMEIIKSYRDERIVLLDNVCNRGIPFTRNRALQAAKGEYIAVLDSDDIASPRRLEKQVQFLDMHPDIGVVASRINFIVDEKIIKKKRLPYKYMISNSELPFRNRISNSSSMFRKRLVDKHNIHYNNQLFAGEDYDFWVQLSKYTFIAILEEPLTFYRTGGTHKGITSNITKNQKAIWNDVINKNIQRKAFNAACSGKLEIEDAVEQAMNVSGADSKYIFSVLDCLMDFSDFNPYFSKELIIFNFKFECVKKNLLCLTFDSIWRIFTYGNLKVHRKYDMKNILAAVFFCSKKLLIK